MPTGESSSETLRFDRWSGHRSIPECRTRRGDLATGSDARKGRRAGQKVGTASAVGPQEDDRLRDASEGQLKQVHTAAALHGALRRAAATHAFGKRGPTGCRRKEGERDATHAHPAFSRKTRADADVSSWRETGSRRKPGYRFGPSVAAASCPCETAAPSPATDCTRRPPHRTSSDAGDGPPYRRCYSVSAECTAREAIASRIFCLCRYAGPLQERPFCVGVGSTRARKKIDYCKRSSSVSHVSKVRRGASSAAPPCPFRVNQATCQPAARPPCTSE